MRPELSSGLASGFQRLIGLVAIYCCLTVTAPAATNPNWFKIVSLTTNNAVFADAPLAGSLAASADHLFASRVGDSSFRRWDANGLANPATFPSGFIIISDLRTEKVYAFADAGGTMTGTGTATTLHELDPLTGQTNGVVIALSTSVAVEDSCGPEFGIFCGWGRVVVGRSQLSDIALPSGQVTVLGTANPFNQGCDPSEPLTGIAEFFGDELYLVACRRSNGGRTGISTHFSEPDLWLWDAATGKRLCSLGLKEPVASEPSPDGRWLLIGTRTEHILWDTAKWVAVARWPSRPGERDVWTPAFSPDSRLLAKASPTGEITVRRVPSGEEVLTLIPPRPLRLQQINFTPDGARLMMLQATGRFYEWDLARLHADLDKLGLGW